MLYLDSIVFTMLRNWCCQKTREALCTDMVESLSSHRTLSLRKEAAARPPIDRRHSACVVPFPSGHRSSGQFSSGQIPSPSSFSSSPATRRIFESSQLIAAAVCRLPISRRSGESASLNASAHIVALQKSNQLDLRRYVDGHAATGRVATPP